MNKKLAILVIAVTFSVGFSLSGFATTALNQPSCDNLLAAENSTLLVTANSALPAAQDTEAIHPAPVWAQIASYGFGSIIVPAFDIKTSPSAVAAAVVNRTSALRRITKARRATPQFSSLEELLSSISELDQRASKPSWNVTDVKSPWGGAKAGKLQKYTMAQLRGYFAVNLPDQMAEIAQDYVGAMTNSQAIADWVMSVRNEMFARMWQAGVRDSKTFNSPTVRDYFLDLVLASRAKMHGFKIRSSGLPYGVTTLNIPNFFRHLWQGHIFVDWTAANSTSSQDNSVHYSRGHLLQVAYAAEHVPHFIELYEYIGKTFDHSGFWSLCLDNASSTTTPFWGGQWVETFWQFFGIDG